MAEDADQSSVEDTAAIVLANLRRRAGEIASGKTSDLRTALVLQGGGMRAIYAAGAALALAEPHAPYLRRLRERGTGMRFDEAIAAAVSLAADTPISNTMETLRAAKRMAHLMRAKLPKPVWRASYSSAQSR